MHVHAPPLRHFDKGVIELQQAVTAELCQVQSPPAALV